MNMNWSRSHPDDGLLFVTSSGLASGNHPSEALCHAMFEVIERDCEWRWERMSPSAQRSRELDPDTVDSPVLRGLLDQFAGAEVSVRMWDMTSEVGIPAFGCSIDEAGPLGRTGPYDGFGCHLSAEIALSRAMTEAAQSRLTFIAGSRDDLYPSCYESITTSDASPRRARPPTRRFQERQSPPLGATFEDDLQTTLRLLAAAGFERGRRGRSHQGGVRNPGRHGHHPRHARDGLTMDTGDIVVFLGPSLPADEARRMLQARYLSPVRCGDVLRVRG